MDHPQQRRIYNPFLLKLIHVKAYYIDKLLSIYLPSVSRVKYDIMKWLIIYNYHVAMIIRDISQLSHLCSTEKFGVDLYLVNFEFILFRLCEQYVKEDPLSRDRDTDDGLYQCEAILKQYVNVNKKGDLMRRLCERYVSRVYFDRHRDEYKNRVRDRSRLFINLKHTLELNFERGIVMDDDIVHYDKAAITGLLYLYYINEFIGDTSRAIHKETLQSTPNDDDTMAYIRGESSSLNHVPLIQEEECNGDLVFLYAVYDKLANNLVDYVCGWCIKEKMTVLNRDSSRVETSEEIHMRRHEEEYNRYTEMTVPCLTTYPLDDIKYRNFILGSQEGDLPRPVFLSLNEGKKHYEAVTYEILFHLRLASRHACPGETCNVCRYTYTHYTIAEFNKQCHSHRYNKERYRIPLDRSIGDRIVFDRYLRHTIIEIVPVLRGFIYRLLYHTLLILYHTDVILKEQSIKDARENDLCAMIDIGELMDSLMSVNLLADIESRMKSVIRESRGVDEVGHVIHEKEDVRRLALDMVILSEIIHSVDRQCMTIEKYERSLSKKVTHGQYRVHTQMMNHLRLLYLYYTRTMYAISTTPSLLSI